MRIGATILISGGKAVQSYNWKLLRPLGNLQNAITFLDKLECDEICLLSPIRSENKNSELHLTLEQLASIYSTSPMSIGGGLRDFSDFQKAAALSVERFVFSSEFIKNKTNVVEKAAGLAGKQAIQCILPMSITDNDCYIFHSSDNKFVPINEICFSRISELADEIIIFDSQNEGNYDTFNFDLIDKIPIEKNRLVISGGIGANTVAKARRLKFAAVLLDNNALYKENHISRLKNANL